MKTKCIIYILSLYLFGRTEIHAQQVTPEVLNNYSIISMAKKGLGTNIILLKIKQANENFDVSTDALVFLKENKINDDVILAMIEKSSQGAYTNSNSNFGSTPNKSNSQKSLVKTPIQIQSQNAGNSTVKKDSQLAAGIIENLNGSGLYYYDDDERTYTPVDPTVVSGSQGKMNAGAYLGFGAAMVSKSFIDGKEANLQITNTRKPTFYFYFDEASTSLNNSNNKVGSKQENLVDQIYGYGNQQNSKAFTPNDFKLIQLDLKRNSRFFKGGKESLGGSTSRISSTYFTTFKYERLSSNLFRIYFPDELDKNGEYCFLYAGNASNNNGPGSSNNKTEIKVFDFGTKSKKR